MSVQLTEQAVVDRVKTVTRRLGWRTLEPGTRLTLCRKVMGRWHRDPGTGLVVVQPLVRLAEVYVWSVRREKVNEITLSDVAKEGFPDLTPAQFVAFFCEAMRCEPDTEVTRIEFRYMDEE